MTLSDFITQNRDELIRRCRAKVAKRTSSPPTTADIDHGVPLFLNQLCEELTHGQSHSHDISKSAREHGHDLLLKQFTVSEVVHDYGDVCQSVTDLAVELKASISTDDFRTMNRCLDDAIAGAVTQYAQEQDISRDGESHLIRHLLESASAGYEALRAGKVGFGGSTGNMVGQSLNDMRLLMDRQRDHMAARATESKPS
jgi:hypothetical protein